MQYQTAFMDCIEMHLIEQMLYISIQFCKKIYSASVSNHCNIALQSHSPDYSKTPQSNAYWKNLHSSTVNLSSLEP